MSEGEDPSARLQHIDAWIGQLEASNDRAAAAAARALVTAVLDLHRDGLSRMMERLAGAGEPGRDLLEECVADRLVASLLLLHGIHPLDLEARVRNALDSVRPLLHRKGKEADFVAVAGDTIRLKIRSGRAGAPYLEISDRQAIEAALGEVAPEITRIEVEAMAEQASIRASRLVVLSPLDLREDMARRRPDPGLGVS